jgi:hypothetical protein
MSKITTDEFYEVLETVIKTNLSDAAFRKLVANLIKDVTKSKSSYDSNC